MAKNFNTNVAMNWLGTDIEQANNMSGVQSKAETPAVEVESKKTVTKKESSASPVKKAKSETAPFTIVGKELKKRQTSLLLKESTYSKLEALSKKNGISVNSCINQILEQVLN